MYALSSFYGKLHTLSSLNAIIRNHIACLNKIPVTFMIVNQFRKVSTNVGDNDRCLHHRTVNSRRSRQLIDISDGGNEANGDTLTGHRYMETVKPGSTYRKDYDNLKPHELRKHIKSRITPAELELKYGKKLAKKLVKRIKLREHGRVSWSARDRVSDAKVKPLTSDDVEIGRRPRIERFHFLNKSIYEMTEDEFYGSFFRDRDRRVDGKERLLRQLETEILDKQNAALSGAPRSRISPRNYWFKPNYVSPTPNEVNKLNSLDLRFVMMNEARKATFDVGVDPDLWDAFLIRVNAISANVSLRTLLRFLQIISKVQLRPNDQLKLLVDSIHRRRGEMKPKHYVFLFQAIGRLKIRDQRIYDNLYEMLLCWSVLRNNFLVKAANALAKLDVCDSILIDPLRQVLGKRLNHFTSTDCLRVKAITVLDLFTDDMVLAFLSRCEYHKHHFRHYSRNLEIIELYMRILAPKLYNRVDESTKQFLIDIRQQTSSKKILNDDLAGEESTPSDSADCRNTTASGERSVALPFGDDAISHCPYLESISNTLSTMGIEHRNYMIAGPFVLDIYEPRSNTVIEVNREYQYYHNTTHLTSTARRRHELIAGMGFRLLHIPYRWWRQLGSDESKKTRFSILAPCVLRRSFYTSAVHLAPKQKGKKDGGSSQRVTAAQTENPCDEHLFNIYAGIPVDHTILPDEAYPSWLWDLDKPDRTYGELMKMFVYGKGIESARMSDYKRFRRLHNRSLIKLNNLRLQKQRKFQIKGHLWDN